MSIELNNKVVIDVQRAASWLAFLVGKTILFRDGRKDATTAANVLAVKVENTPGENGRPQVAIYTTVGVLTVKYSSEFNNFMVLESDGSLKLLGDYTDQMGICF